MKDRFWHWVWQRRGADGDCAATGGRVSTGCLQRTLAAAAENLAAGPGDAVLDIACGNGDFLRHLGPVRLAVGIDRSMPMLHTGTARTPRVHLVCADMRALPFRDETFSRVSCLSAVMYLAAGDYHGFRREVLRSADRSVRIVFGQVLDKRRTAALTDWSGFRWSMAALPRIIAKKLVFISGLLTQYVPDELLQDATAAGLRAECRPAVAPQVLYCDGYFHFDLVAER